MNGEVYMVSFFSAYEPSARNVLMHNGQASEAQIAALERFVDNLKNNTETVDDLV